MIHPLVKGVSPPPKSLAKVSPTPLSRWHAPSAGSSGTTIFPVFDGDNPKLWLSKSVDYFELYDAEPSCW